MWYWTLTTSLLSWCLTIASWIWKYVVYFQTWTDTAILIETIKIPQGSKISKTGPYNDKVIYMANFTRHTLSALKLDSAP